MNYENDIKSAIKRLEDCCDLENSEIGEAWSKLLDLFIIRDYLSEEFAKSVEQEIIKEANDTHISWEIRESEEKVEYTEKRLVYIGD